MRWHAYNLRFTTLNGDYPMPCYAIEDLIPVVHDTTYVHPSAILIGDVMLEANCYIGPGAVLRGDFGRILIGQGSNVQDTCVIHSFPGKDCVVAPDGHIGHGAILHGCRLGQNVLVGMNAVVMDDAVIGAESLIGATAFVKSGFECPARSMVVGNPAEVKRRLSDDEVQWKTNGTAEYQCLTHRSLSTLREVAPLAEAQADRPRFNASEHRPKSRV